MSINIFAEKGILILEYSPYGDGNWVYRELDIREEIIIGKIFYFNKDDLYKGEEGNDVEEYDETSIKFILGEKDEKYFIIKGSKLKIPFDVYFEENIDINVDYFLLYPGISIFRHIASVVTGNIKIVTEEDEGINIKTFKKLINNFPNSYELKKYSEMRIENIIKDEFDKTKNSMESYENYMNKKYSKTDIVTNDSFKRSEMSKYEYLYKLLEKMLSRQEVYNETVWQNEILEIIKIIFPRYIHILREAPVKDYYNNKKKKIDFTLVDYNGNIDIIEIKRPYNNSILTNGTYRGNYVPMRELSGCVMQVEKYIFHLNKGGKTSEELLNNYFHKKIKSSLNLKIINPRGLIIMGRDNGIKENQINDFEIIKRKYNNIMDIITYDDLLRRIKQLIIKYST